MNFSQFHSQIPPHRDTKMNITKAAITTGILMLLQIAAISNTPKTYKIIVFYSYTFIMNAFFQFIFLYFVPKVCSIKSKEKKT
jgi:hypothetical protein